MKDGLVWLASYPKSGSTWFRAIWTSLRNAGRAPADINALYGETAALSPRQFEEATGLAHDEVSPDERLGLRAAAIAALAADARGLVLVKTHESYLRTPSGAPLFHAGGRAKAIVIVRDPRDVAVSFAHHEGRPADWAIAWMDNPAASVGRVTDGVKTPEFLGRWSDHIRSWRMQAETPTHVIRYEDMLADTVGVVAGAVAFLDLPYDRSEIAEAVASCRIDRLRAQEAAKGFVERPGGAAPFFRRGVAGGWREALSQSQAAAILSAHCDQTASLGYE